MHSVKQTNQSGFIFNTVRTIFLSLIACALVFSLSPWGIPGEMALGDKTHNNTSFGWQRTFLSYAYAEDIDTDPEPDMFQQEIERTSSDYNAAVARVDELNLQIADNQTQIAQLEAALPDQQAKSDAAARDLYIMQQDTFTVIDFILSATDFQSFIQNIDYLTHVSELHITEIIRLRSMKADLETTSTTLEQQRSEAEDTAVEAERALAAAQEARVEAQRRAEEEARRQAEQAAAAQAAAEAAQAAQAEEESASKEAGSTESSSSDQGVSGGIGSEVDWAQDKTAFVAEWAVRIDAYLAGSPLAGQGATFASAAWDYGVDPRWSPAISNTESSKGAICFLSHNAWGWGSVSWSSWEEAINDHVRGLARGYGYTISVEAAQKYCPPNWQHWYNSTLAQMEMI